MANIDKRYGYDIIQEDMKRRRFGVSNRLFKHTVTLVPWNLNKEKPMRFTFYSPIVVVPRDEIELALLGTTGNGKRVHFMLSMYGEHQLWPYLKSQLESLAKDVQLIEDEQHCCYFLFSTELEDRLRSPGGYLRSIAVKVRAAVKEAGESFWSDCQDATDARRFSSELIQS